MHPPTPPACFPLFLINSYLSHTAGYRDRTGVGVHDLVSTERIACCYLGNGGVGSAANDNDDDDDDDADAAMERVYLHPLQMFKLSR